jgi:hypothetical protein
MIFVLFFSVSEPSRSQYGSGFGSRYFCDQNGREFFSKIFSSLFQLLIALIHGLRTFRLKLIPSGPQQNGHCPC